MTKATNETVVYPVTVVDLSNEDKPFDCHTPAIFTDFVDAVSCVKENDSDLSEGGTNRYVVIEKTNLNQMYPTAKEQTWFEWNESQQEYVEITTPPRFSRVCGFAIG